jgi:hypothetical protein
LPPIFRGDEEGKGKRKKGKKWNQRRKRRGSFETRRELKKMFRVPFRRLVSHPKACFSSAAATSPLDFVPIPEPELNPLFETAQSALNKSCYLNIDWRIIETETVETAVKRMVAHDIGALAVTSEHDGVVVGVLSERDYLNKVAFLDKVPSSTTVAEIATMGVSNLVSVTRGNPIDKCMEKMLAREIRHLLVREKETNEIVGMISVKVRDRTRLPLMPLAAST